MEGWVPLIVDGLLAILLIGAIVACWIVSRRLSVIREGQEELKKLVDDMNVAMVKAEQSAEKVRKVSEGARRQLEDEMSRARALADELSLMTASANNLADRLEMGVTNISRTAKPEESEMTEQKDILDKLRQAR